MIAFVSGGARSGKSEIAEQRVISLAGGSVCYYLATARVADAEMAERVARHQQSRGTQRTTVQWQTLEAPLAIDQALAGVPNGSAVLLDCLTLWASQVLYASQLSEAEAATLLANTLADARARHIHLVIVSNDINEALPPTDTETWRYLALLQRAHRWLAAEADSVIEVIAGCAVEWKHKEWPCGRWPSEKEPNE